VPSGIWVDRRRWGKKNDINIPNIPGEERDALLAKRAKLKELVEPDGTRTRDSRET